MSRPTSTSSPIPVVDAATQDVITDEQAHSFLDAGLLVLRNVVGDAERAALKRETLPLVERAAARAADDPYRADFRYRTQTVSGSSVAYRVEYVIDKSAACRALLGHPFILNTVEKLQGPNFIPTYDALVFKLAGEAPAIPWHRDASPERVDDAPIFNVDFYLDGSDLTNCVWGVPGSNHWPPGRVEAFLAERQRITFDRAGAVPILMEPGDALIHNILVLHGSGPAQSWFRRVLYYEFRPAETERRHGPHHPRYIPLKQRVLVSSLEERRAIPYVGDEVSYAYRPTAGFAMDVVDTGAPVTYRYPHEEYLLTEAAG